MRYHSTRGSGFVSGAEAILQGLAPDGGLYVPDEIPKLPDGFVQDYMNKSYPERAAAVLSIFLPEFHNLPALCELAYSRFDGYPAPLVKPGDNEPYLLELWHGPTCAFKDMALQLLPLLMREAAEITGEKREICILTATSGDTGKAALEGFCDRQGTRVLVFYPVEGVSDVQKLQMVTQRGENVGVCAVRGNFDDTQTGVKRVFSDPAFSKLDGVILSSANSINLGRLLPQIAYYVSAYMDFLRMSGNEAGAILDVCVPTGNFGNILAALYAKRMGVPIGKLMCASNRNNILTDLINKGEYDTNREFYTTTSPSMDILVSSNWERALYLYSDSEYVRECMQALRETGCYKLNPEVLSKLRQEFSCAWCDDSRAATAIKEAYKRCGYVLDPHTAVAFAAFEDNREELRKDVLIVSTAHPAKFPAAVTTALGQAKLDGTIDIPKPIKELHELPVRFNGVVDPDCITDVSRAFALEGQRTLL